MQDQKASSSWYTIKSSSLVLLTYASTFFSRAIAAVGVPSVINFLHFGTILVVFGLVLFQAQTKSGSRIAKQLLFSLLVLLCIIIASALVNNAGVINVVLDFLLVGEPFLLLVAIVSIPMTSASLKQFRFWLMLFAFIHVFAAYFQYYILHWRKMGGPDAIKGIFLNQGAGHHVGGSIALTAAIYFFVVFKTIPIWLRTLVAVAFGYELILCDAKQVFIEFLAALVILGFTKFKSYREALQYFVITIVAVGFVYWVGQIAFSGSLSFWGNPERLRKAFEAKFSVFYIINSYYDSPLNWLFGLGPGHTIGRLGWLIPDYQEYLQPLGVTSSPVTQAIFAENDTNPLSNAKTGSSMFSLTFSWAGVWGDLGILGLGTYLYLWFLVWCRLCVDNLSKHLLLVVLISGLIFSWMEEPSYMLFMVILIGLQWQERQIKQREILPKSSKEIHFFEK